MVRDAEYAWVESASELTSVPTIQGRPLLSTDDAAFTGRGGYDFVIDAAASRQDLWIASVRAEKLPAARQR